MTFKTRANVGRKEQFYFSKMNLLEIYYSMNMLLLLILYLLLSKIIFYFLRK